MPDVWYYVAGVYSQDGGYLRTYLDGSLHTEMTTNAILYDYALTQGQILTVGGISTPLYVPVTSPANLTDPEGTNNLKVNFKDYTVLLDSWGVTEQWPAW